MSPRRDKVLGLSGGKSIQTFTIRTVLNGVLICYDVEPPTEPHHGGPRHADTLFVPVTDTQNAYSRVKVCAHARAIENECF